MVYGLCVLLLLLTDNRFDFVGETGKVGVFPSNVVVRLLHFRLELIRRKIDMQLTCQLLWLLLLSRHILAGRLLRGRAIFINAQFLQQSVHNKTLHSSESRILVQVV